MIIITTDACNMGRGRKVDVEIYSMDYLSTAGLKAKIERRFSGGKESSRYQAARYIRKIRQQWRDGLLMEMLEG